MNDTNRYQLTVRSGCSLYVAVIVALLFASTVLLAKPQIVSWTVPTTDCDGGTLIPADLVEFELIYSTSPMPMPSDSAGACDVTPDPEAPAGAITVPVPVTETSAVLNLQPGQTYYFRARVSAFVNGNWSSWAGEIDKTVPYGRPDRVIMSDGWVQHISYLIEDPVIRLN